MRLKIAKAGQRSRMSDHSLGVCIAYLLMSEDVESENVTREHQSFAGKLVAVVIRFAKTILIWFHSDVTDINVPEFLGQRASQLGERSYQGKRNGLGPVC